VVIFRKIGWGAHRGSPLRHRTRRVHARSL
jgi:hypothetical protein